MMLLKHITVDGDAGGGVKQIQCHITSTTTSRNNTQAIKHCCRQNAACL